MSQSTATPPVLRASRRKPPVLGNDSDARSIAIGLSAVLVIHLLLWLLGPRLLRVDHAQVSRSSSSAREFNIELAPDEVAPPPKDPAPSRFVETNPEAPENTPDKTNNFAAQNQQVAQEKPTPDGTSDRPALEGRKDFESNQIVSGRLTEPVLPVAPEPPAAQLPPADTPLAPPRAEQNPLAGTEKIEGDNLTGFGSSLAKRLENAQAAPEHIEGAKDAQQHADAAMLEPAIDPRRPRPRPQVVRQQQVRPAILAENRIGTRNVGLTAIDAKWSEYGAYLQRMADIVQIQWERIILQMAAMPARGSTVSVKFVMNEEGRITDIKNVESNANITASNACVSAITDRAPYGPWTEEMKAVLGSRQEMTFTFYYQ